MKHIAIIFWLGVLLVLPSGLMAQVIHTGESSGTENHGEFGVYADYFHFSPDNLSGNFVGVGGRLGFNMNPSLALEAEMNYDFARNFTTTTSNGATTTFVRTRIRPLTGLLGPKLQFGTTGPIRAFVTGKVGFIDFSESHSKVVSGTTVSNSIAGVGGPGTHLAVYPAGGVELFLGPLGLRIEAGDEIYVNNGTHNNLRLTFGPHIRF